MQQPTHVAGMASDAELLLDDPRHHWRCPDAREISISPRAAVNNITQDLPIRACQRRRPAWPTAAGGPLPLVETPQKQALPSTAF